MYYNDFQGANTKKVEESPKSTEGLEVEKFVVSFLFAGPKTRDAVWSCRASE